MNIEVKTVNTVTFSMDEPEARSILVDPTAFQEQLRTALADAHDTNDHRKGQLNLGGGNGRIAKVERRTSRDAL